MANEADESKGLERIRNIWAPWRMEYIESLRTDDQGCFLCRCRDEPENDGKNFVLWRGRKCFVVLNRFPYTGGHALIAPFEHVSEMVDMDGPAMQEMMEMLRDYQQVLREALQAQGFNVGINIGRCAGAGLPDHLHAHIVPRWGGDTNFMSVCSDVRVIPTSLEELYAQLRQASERLHLPNLSGT